MDEKQEVEADLNSVLPQVAVSLLVFPSLLLLAQAEKDSLQADILRCILGLTLTTVLVYYVFNNVKKRFKSNQKSPENIIQRTILSMFSSIDDSRNCNSPSEKQQNNNRPRIDPKYFKPKFIIHELVTIWETTYTVITWGSFHVIGGTIVATERLARKIKTKCTREQQYNRYHNNNSTGRAESFSSYDSFNGSTTGSDSNRSSYRRMRSWAKRSYSSAKKKFNKFASTTSVPQIANYESTTRGN